MVHVIIWLVSSMIACEFTHMVCNAHAFFPFPCLTLYVIDLSSLSLLYTVFFLVLTPPCPPTQVAVWENSVLHLRVLWHVVWHLQSDHSNPSKHGVLCESMLSTLW